MKLRTLTMVALAACAAASFADTIKLQGTGKGLSVKIVYKGNAFTGFKVTNKGAAKQFVAIVGWVEGNRARMGTTVDLWQKRLAALAVVRDAVGPTKV